MTTQSKPKPKPQLKKQQQSLPCKLQPTTDNNQLNNLLEQELKNVNWEVIGFSEMRRPGEAVVELPNNNILYTAIQNNKDKAHFTIIMGDFNELPVPASLPVHQLHYNHPC